MDDKTSILVRILSMCCLSLACVSGSQLAGPDTLPDGFLLGFATASYQIEGAWNEENKGENIWDRFTHRHPERIAGGANGDTACDSYHKYKEDVALLHNLGAQVYRFSLSWSRILPTGEGNTINPAGIDYYDKLINELLKSKIQPMVTLYHWDLPQPLQDLGGWANPLIANYFEDYSRVAFQNFGDRVKHWITFNEPVEVCLSGYGQRKSAPGLNLHGVAEYLCAHNLLISHARAYRLYDRYFRPSQNGTIGITLSGGWNEPASDSAADREAAETVMQFQIGWFAHPIVHGGYPPIMRENVDRNSVQEGRIRSRLPVFDNDTVQYVRGTADFLGLNHYTTNLAKTAPSPLTPNPSWKRDCGVLVSKDPSWPGSASLWLKVVPWGFRKQLQWMKKTYNNTPVFVTENGFSDAGQYEDDRRIEYHRAYLRQMIKALYVDKCNVLGYLVWSLIDNFEWEDGYRVKFGVYHVDFQDPNRTRSAKASVNFFKQLMSTRKLP